MAIGKQTPWLANSSPTNEGHTAERAHTRQLEVSLKEGQQVPLSGKRKLRDRVAEVDDDVLRADEQEEPAYAGGLRHFSAGALPLPDSIDFGRDVKVVVPLTRQEVEEDFWRITGCPPPHAPRQIKRRRLRDLLNPQSSRARPAPARAALDAPPPRHVLSSLSAPLAKRARPLPGGSGAPALSSKPSPTFHQPKPRARSGPQSNNSLFAVLQAAMKLSGVVDQAQAAQLRQQQQPPSQDIQQEQAQQQAQQGPADRAEASQGQGQAQAPPPQPAARRGLVFSAGEALLPEGANKAGTSAGEEGNDIAATAAAAVALLSAPRLRRSTRLAVKTGTVGGEQETSPPPSGEQPATQLPPGIVVALTAAEIIADFIRITGRPPPAVHRRVYAHQPAFIPFLRAVGAAGAAGTEVLDRSLGSAARRAGLMGKWGQLVSPLERQAAPHI
eukprot:jgi/Mesen1/5079/ME000252S04192